jgi:hypothetical protein
VKDFYRHFRNHTRDEKFIHKRHVFVDRKAPVLYVAHIDTVHDLLKPKDIRIQKDSLHATGLDDRLGCYLAFRLNLLGLRGDVLITDHEEINLSTAKYFKTEKEYNWVVEFDRKGDDVVTYGIDSKEFLKNLKKIGFSIGKGTKSDLSELYMHNKPCMFNIGVGYHDPHSFRSYVDFSQMASNVKKFAAFYTRHKDTPFVVE